MKFYIGSMVVELDSIPDFHILENFFRRPAPDSAKADFSWEIFVVDQRSWKKDVWEDEDSVWTSGREQHQFKYNLSLNRFRLKIVKNMNAEGLYWLRRDLFGGFGSVSCQQIIHSSAVIYNGEGYIFSAPSETGKTTLFNNLKCYAEQVNDESNWVYKNSDGNFVLINQNYYFGDSDVMEVPVYGIYLLEQSPVCSVENVNCNMEAFTILLSVHPPFNFMDPFLEKRSDAIRELQKSFPVRKFKLNRDPKELVATLFNN